MIVVAGGVYRERCVQPRWNALLGSAGRAAAAISYLHDTKLVTYVDDANRRELDSFAKTRGVVLQAERCSQTVSFDYVHPLSVPVIQPSPQLLAAAMPLRVQGDAVLRFGMMESTVIVDG